jgi:hypothetical protein
VAFGEVGGRSGGERGAGAACCVTTRAGQVLWDCGVGFSVTRRMACWGRLAGYAARDHMLSFYLSFLACLFVMGKGVVDWAWVLATDCAVAGDPGPMH